jgi:fermentation-respiration switch protein FrsA (DUF1100 family)
MWWWTGLGIAAGAYGAALGLACAAQRRFIYFPDRVRPEPDRALWPGAEVVRLETSDGLRHTAWYEPPRRSGLPTLVYFHGNARNLGVRTYKIVPYLAAGLGVLLTSWRGFSGNAGRPSEQGLYADGRAALDFVARRSGAQARLILYGESLGTGVAVQLATEQRPAAVVLEAPYTSVPDVAAWRVPIAPVAPLIVDRFDSLAKIGRLTAPLLIVHGERDQTIPVRFGRRLYGAANQPKEGVFPPQAGHLDLYDHGMARIVLGFLARQGLT